MSASVTAENPTPSLSLTALYEAPPSTAPTTDEDAVLFIVLAAPMGIGGALQRLFARVRS